MDSSTKSLAGVSVSSPNILGGSKQHMDKPSPYFSNLKCRECARLYPKEAIHVCDFDFGPLEAAYDYDAIKAAITPPSSRARKRRMWRYRELLPIDGEPTIGRQVGFTPLVRADRLAKSSASATLWIKNDTVNYPTLSFKDRVVSVALNRAKELGFKTVACASTGNLANSVAANAAAAGLKSYVLIPADLEQGKVLGSLVYGTNVIGIHGAYDQVNRLCSEIAGKYGWGFVNVNMRPYYAEGSKTMGFEICEQLDWRIPRHTVVPMASGSLLTKISQVLQRIHQGRPRRSNAFLRARRPGHRLLADLARHEARHRYRQARPESRHHRQIPRHRHARRRLLRHPRHARDRRHCRRRHR